MCVALGAGNQQFLALGDVLHQAFGENCVVALKYHPIQVGDGVLGSWEYTMCALVLLFWGGTRWYYPIQVDGWVRDSWTFHSGQAPLC